MGVYYWNMKPEIKKRSSRRLKIIEGQIRGLQKMIANGVYCVNIFTQSFAIKQALSGVEDLILENHLSTHARDQIKKGEENRAVKEILKIYKLSRKK